MKILIATVLGVAAIGFGGLFASAQGAKDPGVPVGVQAPAIAGTAQDGRSVTFADLRGEKGLVIAFVRSADWCPFCKQQLKDLNTIAPDIEARGFKLAALSYDKVETLGRFATANKINYTLVSDPKSVVIDAFGIRNKDVASGSRMDGIPHPAIFVIAANGKILDKLYEESYRKRPPTDLVVKAVDKALLVSPTP